ncbi:hypothetical protein LCGC14_2875610 [marine sediment metagenome]|uniref:Uncharacterized protein n=1 Tax=marine sediment metagenome TaxID=412755 RepID=A0A0F8Y1K6_9ZZZZ
MEKEKQIGLVEQYRKMDLRELLIRQKNEETTFKLMNGLIQDEIDVRLKKYEKKY